MYVSNKEALALERSEVASLHKAFAKEQESHALTKKANIALDKKYCSLDEKHKELELQYSLLRESNSQPSNAKDISIPSTSQGCGKCYNLDLNIYATNLANMEVMRKEIARLNEMIAESVQSKKKEQIGTVQPAQTAAVPHSKGGSAAPRKNGKATNLSPDQTEHI
jgi:hypothetical protein